MKFTGAFMPPLNNGGSHFVNRISTAVCPVSADWPPCRRNTEQRPRTRSCKESGKASIREGPVSKLCLTGAIEASDFYPLRPANLGEAGQLACSVQLTLSCPLFESTSNPPCPVRILVRGFASRQKWLVPLSLAPSMWEYTCASH